MEVKHSLFGLLLTSSVIVLAAQSALAEVAQQGVPTSNILRLNQLERPVTSSVDLLAQEPATATVIEVTEVRINQTQTGIEVLLETANSEALKALTRSEGNTLIADVPNAQLRLPDGNTFRQENPVSGIAEITVANSDPSSIQVRVTGEASVPKVELFDSNEGLILALPTTAGASPNAEVAPATPEQANAETDEEIEVLVLGEQDGYSVPTATTATRTDTPLRDVPQSVQVVPQEVLRDQQVTRLEEAVRNVSGVTTGDTFGNTRDNFVIRGFSTDFGGNILRDGFRSNGFNSGFNETANLERVEVLKGPASVLFGNLAPGGIINLVTKKPLEEPFYSATLEVGNYGFYRPNIDLSGPLNPDKTVLYRLNGVYQNSNTFRDFDQGIERIFIAPVLSWQLGEQTNLRLEFDYLNDERPFDRGLIAIGDEVADIPFERILGEPDDVSKLEQIGTGYTLEHRFNENLAIRNAFRFLSSDTFDYRADPVELDEETGILTRNFRSNDDISRSYGTQTELVAKFATGSVQHTLLFGADLFWQNTEGTQRRLPAGLTPDLNIFEPVYNQIPRPALSELTNVVRDDNQRTNTVGIFLQDQIDLADNWHLLVGGRFDILDQEGEDKAEDTTSEQNVDAFSPRIGIVYQPIEPISLYASYSRSFQPNIFTRADGSFLEPERGTQYEVGIKGEFLDGRLAATLAAYQITKTNVAATDPENEDYSIAIGEQRSRGIELDVIGEILPGWNIIASYAYTDAEVTESSEIEGTEGNRLNNVPYNAASLWTTYEIQSGDLEGLGFGFGLFFVGERQGDIENTFDLPSYLRTDAAIYYRRNNWRAAVNFKNLFDVDYIRSAEYREAIAPGEPFTVVGSISVDF
jgi:iron complex outermembrane receptor protein